ncbi:glutaredoxin-like isoform X2 [Acanthaster planci]|uniref:Glutaredoxin-like isoform X2 n=1 Tax=Acanthaster planci TaxID=133434 RepID=A0A8B7Z8M1_ACAPL|nr:glutaredoxin-like isoform X2 [Acanthaster planci]
MAAPVRNLVRGLIEAHRVMVFSKSTCPFCLLAKSTLKEAGVRDFKVLEIELRPDVQDIQKVLCDMTGISTVPSVFIDKEYVGGGTDVQRKHESGELERLLRGKGIIHGNSET